MSLESAITNTSGMPTRPEGTPDKFKLARDTRALSGAMHDTLRSPIDGSKFGPNWYQNTPLGIAAAAVAELFISDPQAGITHGTIVDTELTGVPAKAVKGKGVNQ